MAGGRQLASTFMNINLRWRSPGITCGFRFSWNVNFQLVDGSANYDDRFKGDLQDILRFIVFQIAEYAFKSARTSLKVEKNHNFQLFSTFLLRQYCIERVWFFLIFWFFSFHVFAGENHQCFVDIIMNFTKLDALYESCNHFYIFKNYQLCGRQIASNS